MILCPACFEHRHERAEARGTYTCTRCGALIGTLMNADDLATLVTPMTHEPDPAEDRMQYFDLVYHRGGFAHRVHGWRDRDTGRLIQEG